MLAPFLVGMDKVSEILKAVAFLLLLFACIGVYAFFLQPKGGD